jgi:hypothetical protein
MIDTQHVISEYARAEASCAFWAAEWTRHTSGNPYGLTAEEHSTRVSTIRLMLNDAVRQRGELIDRLRDLGAWPN